MSKQNEENGFLKPFKQESIESSEYLLALEDSRYVVSYISDSSKGVDDDGDDHYRQDFMIFDTSKAATTYYDSLSKKKGICNLVLSVVVDREQLRYEEEEDELLAREELFKEIQYHKAFQECYYIYRDGRFYSSDKKATLVDKLLADLFPKAGNKSPDND